MFPISIYIHWPFCTKKCPYCDFNSFVTKNIDHEKWRKSYLKAISFYEKILQDRKIKSIFFGGGTPSLAQPHMIECIINELDKNFSLDKSCEITIEANPTSVEANKFADFKIAGINRVSLGIQSFNDESLKFLGRNHNAAEAKNAIEAVASIYSNYSLDFIYALPNQSSNAWERELLEGISYASQHLSLYQLTIEEKTKFGLLAQQGLLKELNEEVAADLFKITTDITQKHQFNRYEVSNHAKNGFESIHNMNYWEGGDYVGIGPGAHGRIGNLATVDEKQPENWLNNVNIKNNGICTETQLTDEEKYEEKIMMGLRTKYGVDYNIIKNKDTVNELIDDGFLEKINNKIVVSEKGIFILNSITQKILS